jgi:iron(II)-dependent oxidoreductase
MADMRGKATYDLQEVDVRLRAAGEESFRQTEHEYGPAKVVTYSVAEADALLPAERWRELDTVIAIPAGEFDMGTDSTRADPQDGPSRRVTLAAYKIDKYLVTNAQYARFVAATGHRPPLHWVAGKIPPGLELHPVTMVSWYDAKRYAAWAGKRLPTEAEWERAARGVDGRRWPWVDKMDPKRVNTYYQVGATTAVDAYPLGASADGAFDMAGNVYQWVADDFAAYPGSDAPDELFKAKVPALPTSAAERSMRVAEFSETDERYKVLRGGSWKSDPFSTSTYHRNFSWPHFASDFFGFRCAEDVNEQ